MKHYPSKVVDTPSCGKALVATKDLAVGTIVQRFEGPIITYSKVTPDMICYAINVGDTQSSDQWIVSKTNAIFANHSCDPNCIVDDKLNLVTIRPIKKDEELTYSYNQLEPGENPSDFVWDCRWNFECTCGSTHCQKHIDKYIRVADP